MSLKSTSSKGSTTSFESNKTAARRSTSTSASSAYSILVSPASLRQRARVITGPWADQPFLLLESPTKLHDARHPVIFVADDMTHQHNAALRGLNAIYMQAPYIKTPQDVTDLLFLTQCWGLWVKYYHDLRRTRILPKFEEALQRPGCIMSLLRKDLHFVPLLNRLLQYVQAVHPRTEAYDSTVFQDLIMELGLVFRAHLVHLICILTDLPRLCSQTGLPDANIKAEELSQLYRSYQKHADDIMDPNIVLPMLVRMRDITYEGGNNWPGLSLVATHAIGERLSKAHAGAWRFLPCDIWGKPKDLLFRGRGDDTGKESCLLADKPLPALPPRSPARLQKKPITNILRQRESLVGDIGYESVHILGEASLVSHDMLTS